MSQARAGLPHAVACERGPSRNPAWLRDIVFSREETAALARWCGDLDDDPYHDDFAAYDARLASRLDALPVRFTGALRCFGAGRDDVGVVRLRGLPIPRDLPLTPAISYAAIRRRVGTEPIMLALSMLVGGAMSLPQMRDGHRVHNIYALREDAETQKASNAVRLEFHTEMAFQEAPPDALAILCLRASDDPPATGFCDLRPVWRGLGAHERDLLQEPAFAFRYSGPEQGRQFFDARPVAGEDENGLHIQYDCAAHGVTPAHDAALAALRRAVADASDEITLAPGDVTLIDNRRVVHGRSPISPRHDGGDRWLQRCLLRLGC